MKKQSGAIATAIEARNNNRGFIEELGDLGIMPFSNPQRLLEFLSRAYANPKFGNTLKKAKRAGIPIYLSDEMFCTPLGCIEIEPTLTDNQITEFLLGPKPRRKSKRE